MSIDTLKNAIPDYAKDIKLNFGSMVNDETLTGQQLWGSILSCALAGRNEFVIQNILAEAEEQLSEDALTAAKAASSIMAMNNVYYRFVHLASNKEYQTMPAKLRMNIIGNPGVDKADFELWSLAVSVMNGCGMCIDAHEKQLVDHGITKAQIQSAAKIGAIMMAVSVTLDGEQAMQSQSLAKAA